MAKYTEKVGATGKKYTIYDNHIKVTYRDGSERIVRPTDASYNVTKEAMEKDIAGRNFLGIGNKKSNVTAANALGNGKTDGLVSMAGETAVDTSIQKENAIADRTKSMANLESQVALNKALKNVMTQQQTQSAAAPVQTVQQNQVQPVQTEQKNNNIVNALLYGLNTGVNNTVQNAKSGALGIVQTGADLIGADKAADNLEQMIRNTAERAALEQAQLAEKYNVDEFGSIAKGVSDVTSGTVNMVPAILAAILTPQGKVAAAGKSMQLAGKVARALPSTSVMGLNAGGGGINQALNEGAELDEAKQYGAATAVKEVTTELPFAGIKYLPGLKNVGETVAGRVANETAKKIAGGVANMAGEGAEEALAEIIDPFIQRATYNENAETASGKDVAYAALIGALTAGALNTGIKGVEKVLNVDEKAQNLGKIAETAQNAQEQSQSIPMTENPRSMENVAQNQSSQAVFEQKPVENIQNQKTVQNAPKITLEMSERTYENVGDKKVKAYQQENPSVKPFQQEIAARLLSDLQIGQKGGREVGVDPETRNVTVMNQVERMQSEPINRMLDDGMSYSQIEDGLQRIVEDNGKENTANAKRAELYVHDAMKNGYNSVTGEQVKGNAEYRYRDMNREELQEIYDRLDNSFSGNAEADAAIISEMETVQNLLNGMQQEQPTGENMSPVAEEHSANNRMSDYEDADTSSLSADVLDFWERATTKSGLNIRIVNGLPDNVNGMYRDGIVYLNVKRIVEPETIQTVTAHEVYHAMKATNEFRNLQDVALDFYRTINPSLTNTDLARLKIDEYAAEGVELTENEAYEELAADFMELALSEPKVAERIWTEKPTLAQRILWFIEDMLFEFKNRKLSDLEYQQAALLYNAQRMYSEGLQSMKYNGQSSETGESRYMFAGVNSRTADLEALARARQLEADGADMESIRQETGWVKSKLTGGKWAYEIDDSNSYVGKNAPRFPDEVRYHELEQKFLSGNITMDEINELTELNQNRNTDPRRNILMDNMYHPDLYEAYPELRNLPFEFVNDIDKGVQGRYSGRRNGIKAINNMNYDDRAETVLHEVQHAVQDIEGFPQGSSIAYWNANKRLTKEAREKITAAEKKVDDVEAKFRKEWPNDEINLNLVKRYNELDRIYFSGEQVDVDRLLAEMEQIEEAAETAGFDDLLSEYLEAQAELSLVKKYPETIPPMEAYMNTAGEIMARDTTQRRNLNAEQRRQKQPAMGDENTVYAEGGNSYSIGRTTDGKPVVKIETDIFANMQPGEKKHKVVADYIKKHIGEVYTIIESGQKVYIGKELPGEYTQSGSAKSLYKDKLNAKNQAAQGLGEMIEIASNRNWKKNEKKKHEHDAKYGWYRYSTKFALPDGQVYDAKLLIRNSEDGKKYLYDMIDIKKDSRSAVARSNKERLYGEQSSPTDMTIINKSLSENLSEINDDVRYSIKNSSRYQELIDRYGSIDPGENPNGTNRDVKVPKQISDFDKTRKFTRTAMEAEQVEDITANMIADDLTADMQSGRFTYEPTSNREQVNRANQLISQTGWEQQTEQFRHKYRSGESMTADDIVLGERLIQEAQKAGDYETAVQLIADVAAIGTEAGRSVQALKVLKRLTPEGQVMALKRIEQRINGSLAAQGKQAVTLPEGIAEEMLQARGSEKQSEIWDKAIQELANQVPATLADKVNAWRYLAMLSNPKTHIRNMFGNATMRAVMNVQNVVQAGGEALFLSENNEHTAAIRVPKEYRKFAEWDYENHAKQMLAAGGGRYNDEIGLVSQNKQIFSNQALESARKFNSELLDAEDMIFKKAAYVDAMSRYMYANGLSPSVLQNQSSRNGATYERGQNFAVEQAKKATFQEASKLAQKLSEIENMNNVSKIVMGALVPFKKTPVNILKRGIEYSPIGVMNGVKKAVVDIRSGKATPAEAIDALTSGLTGTGIMMLGCFMASQGWLSGGADDDDQRKSRYDSQMGSQNYALVLPDGSTYTIDWLAPSVMPLMVGAELYKQWSGNETDSDNATGFTRALEAITKVGNPVLEMSMLQGLTDALQSYNSGTGQFLSDFAISAASSYGGQFIPQPVAALSRTIDDTVRSSYAPKDSSLGKEGETFLRQQRSKIPSLPILNELGITSASNEASIDVWGNERKREFAGDDASDVAMRVINNFINPGTYSSNKRTELDNKLNELYKATGNSSVLPKSAASYIDESSQNPKVYLDSEEYTQFAKTKGQKSQKYVSDFVNSNAYDALDNDTKADIVADLYSLANYEARKEALNGRSIDYSVSAYENVLESGVEPYEYYATKARLGGKWSDYDAAAKFSDYADRMQMQDDKFVEVYDALGDLKADKDKNGKTISGSRQNKVESYLNSELKAGNITKEQWWYFYTKEYSSKAKNAPYSWIREANK